MPAFTSIAAATAAGGAIAGGIGQAVSGGGGGGGQLQYTPEQAVEMLDWFDGSMADLDTMQDSLTTVLNYTDERLAGIQDYIAGTLPEADFMKTLTTNAQEIAAAFGGDAKAAIEAGFLDETTARYTGLIEDREGQTWNANQKELDDLRAMEATGFKDPGLESKLEEQRKSLEQSLARQGVPPAQRAIAISQFEASAESQRFTRSEELKAGATSRAQARIGMSTQSLSAGVASMQTAASVFLEGKKQRLAEATAGASAVGQMLQYGQATAGNIAQILQARAANQLTNMQAQMAAMNQGKDMWAQIGQTKFDGTTTRLMESGAIGPGSIYDQTGISRHNVGDYQRRVGAQEDAVNRGTLSPDAIAQNPNDVMSADWSWKQEHDLGRGAAISGAAGGSSPYTPPGFSTRRPSPPAVTPTLPGTPVSPKTGA